MRHHSGGFRDYILLRAGVHIPSAPLDPPILASGINFVNSVVLCEGEAESL